MTSTTFAPPTPEQLAGALRAGAKSPAQTAAVRLLLSLPPSVYAGGDLARYMTVDYGLSGQLRAAYVRWPSLHVHAAARTIRLSAATRRTVLVACSLAVPGAPISLHDVLADLDAPSAEDLRAALDHLVRGHS